MERQIWVNPKNENERKETIDYLLNKGLTMKSQINNYPIVINVNKKEFFSAGSTGNCGAYIPSGGKMLDLKTLKEKLEN